MARWRKRQAPRIEPPSWYRTFDPAAWDEMDAHERRMMDGRVPPFGPWPDYLHEVHARRRWEEAKHAYRQDHQDLAEQEFEDLVAMCAEPRD